MWKVGEGPWPGGMTKCPRPSCQCQAGALWGVPGTHLCLCTPCSAPWLLESAGAGRQPWLPSCHPIHPKEASVPGGPYPGDTHLTPSSDHSIPVPKTKYQTYIKPYLRKSVKS